MSLVTTDRWFEIPEKARNHPQQVKLARDLNSDDFIIIQLLQVGVHLRPKDLENGILFKKHFKNTTVYFGWCSDKETGKRDILERPQGVNTSDVCF